MKRERGLSASFAVALILFSAAGAGRGDGVPSRSAGIAVGDMAREDLEPASTALREPAATTLRIEQGTSRTARVLMDSLATRIVLQLGYAQVEGTGSGWAMAGSPAVTDRRAFEKPFATSGRRRLELGRAAHPAGGYEIHVAGAVLPDATGTLPFRANPDVVAVAEAGEALLATLPTAPAEGPPPDFGIEVRTLGYAQADGVFGLLKALGYDTIEYHATKSDVGMEKLYEPIREGAWRLPVVVRLLEGDKTSIMDPAPHVLAAQLAGVDTGDHAQQSGVPDMGGTYLHDVTTGEPLQRMLIVHDPDDPESLRRLLDLIDHQIDVPARQIVIEALVLEITRDKINDLGLTFSWIDNDLGAEWGRNALGQQTEFTFDFDKFRTNVADLFQVKLHALLGNGDAKILSNPSVLVLDGRQARIQVGQRVPVITSTATATVVEQHVEYETVGIVLNLRPRVNSKGSEVTMQVETIVSAVDPTGTTTTGDVSAPTFDNRLVQTYCRIADNTPFIVGGLISEDRREQIRRVPGLSRLPLLGPLFRRKTHAADNKEVIIVLTPHVVPKDEKGSSLVIPKDSAQFDSFDKELFRNKYRVRRADVFDLRFVQESAPLSTLRERVAASVARNPALRARPEVAAVLDGAIPGEDILVRRMLWETIRRTGFAKNVDPSRIITFRRGAEGAESLQLARVFDLETAMPSGSNTLVLSFEASADADAPAVRAAGVSYAMIPAAEYDARLMADNPLAPPGAQPSRSTILLSRNHPGGADLLDFLRSVLVLKEILRLNANLPQRIGEFYDGREIIYPSDEELRANFHVVDSEAARLFFEVQQYYPAFQCTFNRRMRDVDQVLDPSADLGPVPACVPQAPGPLVRIESEPAAASGTGSVGRRRKSDGR